MAIVAAVSVEAVVSMNRAPELDWLNRNRAAYIGKWVALDGDRLIAASEDARVAFDAAKKQGIRAPFLIYVQPEPEFPFGGW